ncbi:MAG: PQQ-binding-like beta-propeller repeat protein [bacterium]|nr:PQQ-binding-like beta-propeller repeat protein [bacterium]
MMRPQRLFCELAVAGALAAIIVSPASASEAGRESSAWSQFRGPNRDGVSAETGLLDRWPEGGPEILWRVSVGAGYSGVAVVGDGAFAMWQEDDQQLLLGLDAATGQERWRHPLSPAYTSPYGDGPRTTPVVHGETAFAVGARGHLHAVKTSDGTRLWERDLASLGGRVPSSGYSSTPIVEEDRLIAELGAEDGAFVAFDTTSGEPVWRAGSDMSGYSSPIAMTVAGIRQVVFFSARGLFAVAPRDGHVLWSFPWESRCPATGVPLNAASPIHIPPDRIFISSAYGPDEGAAVLRIVEEDGRFAAQQVWRNRVLNTKINSAIYVDGMLYGFDGGMLKSIDAATGQESWRARGFQRGSLIAADGKLIVFGEQGKLALVAATPEQYRELASMQALEGRSWTSPSLADGRLYLRNDSTLVCLDLIGKHSHRRGAAGE